MDLNADWIWDAGPEKPVNHYVYVRNTFDVPAKPMEVLVRVCADSRYKLYVNGKLVGRGPVRSDPRWQYYDTYDLTRHVHRGKNVIAALIHHYGTGTFTYILGRGGFLLDGVIRYLDPVSTIKVKSLPLVTDGSWKLRPGDAWFRDLPRMSIQLEFPEVYDANRAPDGWTEVGFDDSLWQRATVIGPAGMEPWPSLTAREIPFMYEREIFPTAVREIGIADPTGIELPENNKIPVAAIMSREKKEAAADPEKLASNASALCLRPTVEDIFQVQPMNPRGPKESTARRSWRAANEGKGVCTVYPLPDEERAAGKAVYIVLDFGREVAGHPRIRLSTEGTGMIDLGYGELLINGKVDPFRAGVHYADRYIMKRRPEKGLGPAAGSRVVLEVQTDELPSQEKWHRDKLHATIQIVQSRLHTLGVSQALVRAKGEKQIVVELPGVHDPREVIDQVTSVAGLQFRHFRSVRDERHPDAKYKMALEQDDNGRDLHTFTDEEGNNVDPARVIAESPIILTGDDLKPNARAETHPQTSEIYVAIEFDDEGRKRFADFTRRNIGEHLAIVLDGKILSAPCVKTAILNGKAIIEGGFPSAEEAEMLVHFLNAGALPAPLEVVQTETVSGATGAQEWEVFEKRAFRYMQIDFRNCTAPVTVESVGVNFSTYPVRWRGTFECSDDRLNEIWRIGAYTVQLNMEDAYTDCPWRERTQWWGDARIEALSNYYAFGDPWLVRQGIKQIGQSQRDDGATICFWPGTYDNVIPAFCLYWIMSIWDYYTFTGDKPLVEEAYPKVEKLIGWFEGFKDERGLLTDVGHWMFIEWTNTDLHGTVTALNCLYYHALVNASCMARLAQDQEATQAYASRAAEVKAAINAHLYDAERGAYPEFWSDKENGFSPKISQMANGLVAAYGIAPMRVREEILRHTLDPDNEVVPAGSFYAYYYLLALFTNGMTQEALDYIRTNWGKMLDWGATVFWEHWHTNSSLCHGWASAPTYHLPAWVLGVQPAEPGFRRVTVAPNPGDLNWAKGTVPTPPGDIVVEWQKSDAAFDLVLSIPEKMKADIALPLPAGCVEPDILVNGTKKLPAGVLGKRLSAGRAMFTVTQPGKYTFSLKAK